MCMIRCLCKIFFYICFHNNFTCSISTLQILLIYWVLRNSKIIFILYQLWKSEGVDRYIYIVLNASTTILFILVTTINISCYYYPILNSTNLLGTTKLKNYIRIWSIVKDWYLLYAFLYMTRCLYNLFFFLYLISITILLVRYPHYKYH